MRGGLQFETCGIPGDDSVSEVSDGCASVRPCVSRVFRGGLGNAFDRSGAGDGGLKISLSSIGFVRESVNFESVYVPVRSGSSPG